MLFAGFDSKSTPGWWVWLLFS